MKDLPALAAQALTRAGLEWRHLQLLVLDRHGETAPRVAMLAFLDGERDPAAFIKLAGPPGGAGGHGGGHSEHPFASEAANLAWLAELADPTVSAAVPACLYHGTLGDTEILVTSACPGVRLKNLPPARALQGAAGTRRVRATLGFLTALRRAASPRLPAIP